jgi:rubrerythrin
MNKKRICNKCGTISKITKRSLKCPNCNTRFAGKHNMVGKYRKEKNG